ncbi:MAG: tRNA (adenosine(37)-N6)-threonylcarbamoyltransferase complex dimerization subunit type 1 TsaB [Candidatus Symbiothrix sp.]|jgi:tRNA threonylcarbamoyladenosine biosynthesis protein TsaB|nr:tRNA (adenosine(37)-N6)-threonylcarbamoyltransferase complex dimerization subunit type 1 TsaB [Candidatus Symbiothrix sp.]
MACLLAIETATTVCSVNLSVDGKTVFNRIQLENAGHSALLGVFVSEAVSYARMNQLKIEAVAISAGPGSYTGLRIGVSEAKGLCYGFTIPLIALPTLKIMASSILQQLGSGSARSILCPMIDARRMEVYAALYDENLNEIRPAQADIMDANSYQDFLGQQQILFFGNGSEKCKSVIQSPRAVFIDTVYPAAEAMIPLAEQAFANQDFVDVAYFEPFYLKEFQATTPKNKVLGIFNAKSIQTTI